PTACPATVPITSTSPMQESEAFGGLIRISLAPAPQVVASTGFCESNTGAIVSCTVTVVVTLALRPAESVTVRVTTVSPSGNTPLGLGLSVPIRVTPLETSHKKLSGSPSGSQEPEPSTVTKVPAGLSHSASSSLTTGRGASPLNVT